MDPTGKWINNGDGSFTSEQDDTLWGLQQETGRDWTTSDFTGEPKKLQIGQSVSFVPRTEKNSYKTIRNTREATNHYFFGDQSPVNLDENTKNKLMTHKDQLRRQSRIENQETELLEGNYGIDMTWGVGTFHIGNTTVLYETTLGTKHGVTIFEGFANDGFWDISGSGDGIGSQRELPGGKPYAYVPFTWAISFPRNQK